MRLTIAPTSVAYTLSLLTAYIALSVWGYCFIHCKGKPRPELRIKRDTILTPFLCSITKPFQWRMRNTILSMNELINTEIELRKNQGKLGNSLIVGTITILLIIGALPLLLTLSDDNIKWVNIIMSESYIRLIAILCIPLILGLTAGIILIKSSVKNIAKNYSKEIEWLRMEEENEQNISKEK